jgi:hypothetical protein
MDDDDIPFLTQTPPPPLLRGRINRLRKMLGKTLLISPKQTKSKAIKDKTTGTLKEKKRTGSSRTRNSGRSSVSVSVSVSGSKSKSKSSSKSKSKSSSKSSSKTHKKQQLVPKRSSMSQRRSSSQRRRANFLSTICSDSNVCLTFGRFTDEIKKHFDGFTSFKYVVPPIKRIGDESENGFVNQIEYNHRGYKAYAILKSSKMAEADNLLYEYVVGQYINRMNKIYPCFLETYGFYIYTNDVAWLELQNTPILTNVHSLKDGLRQQHDIDYNNACRESGKLAILIQYFKDIVSLEKCSREPKFIQEELMNALFQLYIPLDKMKDNFTHYDLHLKNVYMYQPVADHYIEYHYWISSTRSISFKSSYILKIIDYGRSYFNDELTGQNSKTIYEKELCLYATDCNEPTEITGVCGENVGFGWLKKHGRNPAKDFYISSQKKNISHDLLPLSRIKENHTAPNPDQLTPDLKNLVNKVVYADYFGTEGKTTNGYPRAIFNVSDAAKFIMSYVSSKIYRDKNNMVYANKTKLGDLHVFLNGERPMRFDSVA